MPSAPDPGPPEDSGADSGNGGGAGAESGTGGGRGERAWRRSLRLIAALLAVWFTVSLGLGVLFAAPLNGIRFFGFPLGFWFAQQGAILVFLGLLVVNAVAMDRIERAGSPRPVDDAADDAADGAANEAAGRPAGRVNEAAGGSGGSR